MYFETGADSLRGILSPGAYYFWGGLSPGHIVLEAYCLGAYCLRGTLSPGRIILEHIVSGRIVSGHHVPPPNFSSLAGILVPEKFMVAWVWVGGCQVATMSNLNTRVLL